MPSIMIVDDEALVLFDLTLTVEDLGHDIFCEATNIDDALDALECHQCPALVHARFVPRRQGHDRTKRREQLR